MFHPLRVGGGRWETIEKLTATSANHANPSHAIPTFVLRCKGTVADKGKSRHEVRNPDSRTNRRLMRV
jgi:hypothetical protein